MRLRLTILAPPGTSLPPQRCIFPVPTAASSASMVASASYWSLPVVTVADLTACIHQQLLTNKDPTTSVDNISLLLHEDAMGSYALLPQSLVAEVLRDGDCVHVCVREKRSRERMEEDWIGRNVVKVAKKRKVARPPSPQLSISSSSSALSSSSSLSSASSSSSGTSEESESEVSVESESEDVQSIPSDNAKLSVEPSIDDNVSDSSSSSSSASSSSEGEEDRSDSLSLLSSSSSSSSDEESSESSSSDEERTDEDDKPEELSSKQTIPFTVAVRSPSPDIPAPEQVEPKTAANPDEPLHVVQEPPAEPHLPAKKKRKTKKRGCRGGRGANSAQERAPPTIDASQDVLTNVVITGVHAPSDPNGRAYFDGAAFTVSDLVFEEGTAETVDSVDPERVQNECYDWDAVAAYNEEIWNAGSTKWMTSTAPEIPVGTSIPLVTGTIAENEMVTSTTSMPVPASLAVGSRKKRRVQQQQQNKKNAANNGQQHFRFEDALEDVDDKVEGAPLYKETTLIPDYDTYPVYSSLPNQHDKIAYKTVEMDMATITPRLSNWKVAEILAYDPILNRVQLKATPIPVQQPLQDGSDDVLTRDAQRRHKLPRNFLLLPSLDQEDVQSTQMTTTANQQEEQEWKDWKQLQNVRFVASQKNVHRE